MTNEQSEGIITQNNMLNNAVGRRGQNRGQDNFKRNEPAKDNLKVIFLGGVGEVGKNMTALEYGDDIIIIDSGMGFPDNDMLGIDCVVQDISYLVERKSKVRGIFITHGHEDHIGSLPYILPQLNVPIYGSRLTMGLAERKLREHPIKYTAKSVEAGSVIAAGKFKVEFIQVTHSIPGSMMLAVFTPVGTVIHSGDFKIDLTPVGQERMDLARLAELGKKGVLLLLCESTNVERDGFSMSEREIGKTFETLFMKHKDKRIFITAFASNVHRMQQAIDLATKTGRKIFVLGRSMIDTLDIATKIGEMKYDKKLICEIENIDKYKDSEVLVILTGSQGQETSALYRLSVDNFPKAKLGSGDTIIISASAVPGNEKAINDVINNLVMMGCDVVYNEIADVHVSGHAYRDELKLIHALTKPKFFMPVHGEHKHLKVHKEMAIELGMQERNIIVPTIGACVEVNQNLLKFAGQVRAGERLVDGFGLGDTESVVLRDRKVLSEEGICVVFMSIASRTGEIENGPEIISRGFIYQEEAGELISEAKEALRSQLEKMELKGLDVAEVKAAVRKVASGYFFKKTKRRPMIITIVNYV
ncbi:MAG: ribonuclease J [Christensenellaceae bacterium]|jgi:ribonuclease J|nr:ribonuclease J [Christensenellaceae bacterium]